MRIENLATSQARLLGRVQINSDSASWNFFFDARNGFWTELLRIQKVGAELKFAIKVKRNSEAGETETVFEKVDPGYPRTEGNQVEWGGSIFVTRDLWIQG